MAASRIESKAGNVDRIIRRQSRYLAAKYQRGVSSNCMSNIERAAAARFKCHTRGVCADNLQGCRVEDMERSRSCDVIIKIERAGFNVHDPAVVEHNIDGRKRRGAGFAECAQVGHRPRGAAVVVNRETIRGRLIGKGRPALDYQRRGVVQINGLALHRLRACPEQFQRPTIQCEDIVDAVKCRPALRDRRPAPALGPAGECGSATNRQCPGPAQRAACLRQARHARGAAADAERTARQDQRTLPCIIRDREVAASNVERRARGRCKFANRDIRRACHGIGAARVDNRRVIRIRNAGTPVAGSCPATTRTADPMIGPKSSVLEAMGRCAINP